MNKDFARAVFEIEANAQGAFAAAWRAHWTRRIKDGASIDFWKEAEAFLKVWAASVDPEND